MRLEAINRKQKDNVHMASVLDVRRPTYGGLYIVRTRVTVGKTQKYYPTGAEMSKKDWLRMPKAKDPQLAETRRSIEASSQVVFNAVKQLCEINAFNFERLNILLGKENQQTVNAMFEAKIQELINADRLSTAEYYQNSLNAFICFKCGKWCERKEMQKCNKNGIELTFQEVSAEQMQRFEQELLSHGYSKATIGMRIRAMRTICNMALNNGIMRPSDYCFKKGTQNSYTIKKTNSRRMALNLNEIKMIADAPIGENEKNRRMSRDLFLFSFWANGLNFADLVRLKHSYYNPKTNEFTFLREKTKNTSMEEMYISFPLFPRMKAIIMEWGNPKTANGYVFPFLKGGESSKDIIRLTKNITHVVNNNLKTLTKQINSHLSEEEQLPEDISTYTARHSFGTILAHKRVPESYIGFALGHSKKSVTDSYIEEYTVEDRKQYNGLLQL
jgi:site-specific recombinase XerD